MRQQREPAIAKAYADCLLLMSKHYFDSGDSGSRESLIATYKDLLHKFLSGRVLAGSGLNIRFLQTVFEQCPSLAWEMHGQVLKCFLVKSYESGGETEKAAEGSRSNRQRLQAIELYQLLIKVAQKDKASK